MNQILNKFHILEVAIRCISNARMPGQFLTVRRAGHGASESVQRQQPADYITFLCTYLFLSYFVSPASEQHLTVRSQLFLSVHLPQRKSFVKDRARIQSLITLLCRYDFLLNANHFSVPHYAKRSSEGNAESVEKSFVFNLATWACSIHHNLGRNEKKGSHRKVNRCFLSLVSRLHGQFAEKLTKF